MVQILQCCQCAPTMAKGLQQVGGSGIVTVGQSKLASAATDILTCQATSANAWLPGSSLRAFT